MSKSNLKIFKKFKKDQKFKNDKMSKTLSKIFKIV